MSFLALTIPLSLLLAAVMLALVLRAVREGQFDDWEGPAYRHIYDDDEVPERPSSDSSH
jgi:cbb3-type cytochrome oxidase maturation protein